MSATELATYLNDHLAGSVAALELLDHLIAHPEEPDDSAFFTRLRAEIMEDQEVLSGLLRELGSGESSVRKAAGWLAEKAAGLKLRWDDRGNAGFHRFEALEGLALGIQGKLSLWRALSSVATMPAVRTLDLRTLARKAEAQHAAVEARRVAAAARAFGEPVSR
ncbi:MAG: hypothetical protein ACREOC_08610 [Gemmatimonadales bacterium]